METKRAADETTVRTSGRHEALHEAVAAVMARLAAGEQQAVWDLHVLAEQPLRRMLRAEARRIDIRIGDDDLLDLTLDAAVDLGRLAKAWHADGALPWVWARRRIAGLVHQHVGVFADELDESHLDLEQAAPVPSVDDPREVLRALARRHPAARVLERGLASVSERDADIWLGVQMEKAVGNRSPAVTVAIDHGMKPDAIRKVVQRVAERLADAA
ncbi:MAG: hypothetical protein ACT452_15470 [Microthrixaceae bacterium]